MSTASTSRRFVLGLSGVQAAEAAQIKALLTFARTRSQADWFLGSEAFADVLLIAGVADLPHAAPAHCIRVHLMDAGQSASTVEHLVRPIQFESFVQLLLRLEAALLDLPRGGMAATAGQADLPPPVDRDHVFRLKRWPPVTVLSADRYHPRLASFLSARAMGLEELSRISGASLDHCQTFLALVRQLGLVEVQDRPAVATAAPHPTPGHAHDAAATPTAHGGGQPRHERHPSHGLISMIRKHLGI